MKPAPISRRESGTSEISGQDPVPARTSRDAVPPIAEMPSAPSAFEEFLERQILKRLLWAIIIFAMLFLLVYSGLLPSS